MEAAERIQTTKRPKLKVIIQDQNDLANRVEFNTQALILVKGDYNEAEDDLEAGMITEGDESILFGLCLTMPGAINRLMKVMHVKFHESEGSECSGHHQPKTYN